MNYKLIGVLFISLFAVRHLLLPGFVPTHDGEFHFVRFWQFEKMLLSGDLFPVWAPDLNSGYGLPLFYYHYPMPNYSGVLFHLVGFSYTDAFELTLASFYIVGVLFFYLWSRSFWATLIFSWTPYWLVNLFVRGSIGEVMASAGMAFVLWAAGAGKKTCVALGTAFIILSHNLAALLFVPIILVYTWRFHRWSVLVGILLAAYFWIPALFGQAYIAGLSNINLFDHFSELHQLLIPSWGTGFSRPGAPFDEMSQQLGIGSILVALATVQQSFILAFIGFFMTRSSAFMWHAFPFLQLFQYPWRLLIIVPFIVGFLARRMPKRVLVVVAVITIITSLSYTRPVVYEQRDDGYYLTRREFTDGTASVGNSISTAWAPWKQERAVQKIEIIEGKAAVDLRQLLPTRYEFSVTASTPAVLRINTVYFPGWEARVGQTRAALESDTDGLMRIDVPVGFHQVQVELHNTSLRKVAILLSLVTFIWLARSAILKR